MIVDAWLKGTEMADREACVGVEGQRNRFLGKNNDVGLGNVAPENIKG